MDNSTMLASMAAHHIPILPSRDPTPTAIHLDVDPKDDGTSTNTVPTPSEPTTSTPVTTQINNGKAETVTDITSQNQTSALLEAEPASVEVQMEIDMERKKGTKTEVPSEIVQNEEPASASQSEVSDSNYTTSAPVKDVSPEIIMIENSSPENLDPNKAVANKMVTTTRKIYPKMLTWIMILLWLQSQTQRPNILMIRLQK
jgi:hypothetical protein